VDFIEYYPTDFSHDFGAAIQHMPQNLSRHYDAACRRVNGDISSHQSDVVEFGGQFSILLITQSLRHKLSVLGQPNLDRTGVYNSPFFH